MRTELERLIDQMITQGVVFEEALKEFEKGFILEMLGRQKNNLSRAATALGIHRNTLTKRLRDYQHGVRTNGRGRRQIAPRRKPQSRQSR